MTEPEREHLLELIEGCVVGRLSETEQQHLAELLRADAEARGLFLEYMDLHATMHWTLQSRGASPSILAECGVGVQVSSDRPGRQDSPAVGGWCRTCRPDADETAVGRMWVAVAAFLGSWGPRKALCVAALVLLVGAGIVWRVWPRPVEKTPPAHLADNAPAASAAPGAGPVLVRLDAAQTRELPLGDKGYLFVQGPADLELVDATRACLRRGRVRVRITSESGEGFVVATPRGEVTDLGTEFGVDVNQDSDTGVVVFEGKVDMAVAGEGQSAGKQVTHLVDGDGLTFGHAGRQNRIMSIVTGPGKAFQQQGEPSADGSARVIADVWDNLPISESKKAYQIVPHGLREDARCYADRPAHEWNGLDERGLPACLVGADYVKTFCNYKVRKDVRIYVKLACPARLFVFLDQRVAAPRWLRNSFRNTGENIGMDEGPQKIRRNVYSTLERGQGPGQSIDGQFSVWERVVKQPEVIELGPNLGKSSETGMYGIAATALEAAAAPREAAASTASE